MSLPLIIYALAGAGVFLLLLPFFLIYTLVTGKHREGLLNRLGFYRPAFGKKASGTVRIWVHAASVGEVAAAVPIITELARALPEAGIVLSTTTAAGQAAARETLGSQVTPVFAPVDFMAAVALALQTVRPDALVLVETEIWPNWLWLAHRKGIRTIVVNGRISIRSVNGYRRVRSLIAPVLATVDAFSMIGKPDAARLKSLGVVGKIAVNGNAKYDRLAGLVTPAVKSGMAALYNLAADTPVLVAGSLRSGEETLLLDVFRAVRETVPDLVCIVAPRHMHRAGKIAAQARALGIDFQMRSALQVSGHARRRAPLVILDTLGELQATYSVAAVVFCGGSLVPLGGQNVLEAAAWGKPVLFGPSMEDFQAEKELLVASGGGSEVADQRELLAKIRFYLAHPDAAAQAGRAGRAMVQANTGAARKHAEVVLRALKKR